MNVRETKLESDALDHSAILTPLSERQEGSCGGRQATAAAEGWGKSSLPGLG